MVASDTTSLTGAAGIPGAYVVQGTVSTGRLEVAGEVYLILMDNCRLKTTGITVNKENKLHIFARASR